MKRRSAAALILSLGLALFLSLPGCSTAPDTAQGKTDLKASAAMTLKNAQAKDPSLSKALDQAAGYAVFPSIGKGAVGVGGAFGQGVLYQNGNPVGYCSMTQGTIGFQLGGQTYSEIIVFATPEALNKFKSENLAFTAQATAVALKSGAAANAKYANGVAVFTMGQGGLMFEASIGGQQFNYQPMENNG